AGMPWPSPVSLTALCTGSMPIALPMRGRKEPRAEAAAAEARITAAATSTAIAADAMRPLRQTPLEPSMAGIVVDAAQESRRSARLTPAGGSGARIPRADLTTRGAGGYAG